MTKLPHPANMYLTYPPDCSSAWRAVRASTSRNCESSAICDCVSVRNRERRWSSQERHDNTQSEEVELRNEHDTKKTIKTKTKIHRVTQYSTSWFLTTSVGSTFESADFLRFALCCCAAGSRDDEEDDEDDEDDDDDDDDDAEDGEDGDED